MIKLENISFAYNRHVVFEDLNIHLTEGNVYGLLGLNGSGKSTMLYLMSGLLRAKSGRVDFRGCDMKDRLPEALQDIYIVPEEFSLPNMTLDRYIKINSPFYPRFSDEMLNKGLDSFEMSRDINLSQLSMGQKKKAFMCFALATNTSLLLMDEPSNGLDIPSKSQFRKAVAECMTDERSIVVSTHQVRDIENLLDRILILDHSKVIVNESINDITDKFSFHQLSAGQSLPESIFVQQSMGGAMAIAPNVDGNETTINVELFFNAVLGEKEKMLSVLNK